MTYRKPAKYVPIDPYGGYGNTGGGGFFGSQMFNVPGYSASVENVDFSQSGPSYIPSDEEQQAADFADIVFSGNDMGGDNLAAIFAANAGLANAGTAYPGTGGGASNPNSLGLPSNVIGPIVTATGGGSSGGVAPPQNTGQVLTPTGQPPSSPSGPGVMGPANPGALPGTINADLIDIANLPSVFESGRGDGAYQGGTPSPIIAGGEQPARAPQLSAQQQQAADRQAQNASPEQQEIMQGRQIAEAGGTGAAPANAQREMHQNPRATGDAPVFQAPTGIAERIAAARGGVDITDFPGELNPGLGVGDPVNTAPVSDASGQIGTINTDMTDFPGNDMIDLRSNPYGIPQTGGDATSGAGAANGAPPTGTVTTPGPAPGTGTAGPAGGTGTTGGTNEGDGTNWGVLGGILGTIFGGGNGNSGGGPVSDNNNDWLDVLGSLPVFGDSGGAGGSATATGGSNWLQDLIGNITQNAGDILSGGINFYGQKEAAEAAERTAGKGIQFNQGVLDQLRADLDPFRQMGVNAIPGAVGAATTDLTAPDQPLDVFGGYENIQDVAGDPSFQFSGDPRGGLDPISATVGGWDQFADENLIQRGGDQWNLLEEDARVRAENMGAARGRLNTQESRDSALKSMLRAGGEMENINQARLNQELARRGSDFGISSGARGQLFGEGFDVGSRGFAERFAADELRGSEARANRQSQMGQQLTEAATRFDQQSQRRDQLWQELLGGDAQAYEKLMGLVGTGQTSAAQAGTGAVGLSGPTSGIYSDLADLAGGSTAAMWKNLGDIFGGLF